MEQIKINYEGLEIWVDKPVADYLEKERLRALAELKRDKRHLSKEVTDIDFFPDEMSDVLALVIKNEMIDNIKRAISTCTEVEKRRLYLHIYKGYKKVDVAKLEGVSETAVRQSIKSAQNKIFLYLNKKRIS